MAEFLHHYTKDLQPGESQNAGISMSMRENCVPIWDAISLCTKHFMYQTVLHLYQTGQHQHIEHKLPDVLPDHCDGGQ